MAFLQLPIRNDLPAYDFQVELDGELFTLGFSFNARANYWVLDISDANEEPLLMGIRIVSGWLLTNRFVNSNLPLGDFFVYDTSGKNEDPTQDDFGTTKVFMYADQYKTTKDSFIFADTWLKDKKIQSENSFYRILNSCLEGDQSEVKRLSSNYISMYRHNKIKVILIKAMPSKYMADLFLPK